MEGEVKELKAKTDITDVKASLLNMEGRLETMGGMLGDKLTDLITGVANLEMAFRNPLNIPEEKKQTPRAQGFGA